MPVSDFRIVSPHILELLTEQFGQDLIFAKEDIITTAGKTVVQKGQTLTPEVTPNLSNQKLIKPLETSISSRFLLGPHDFTAEAYTILKEFPVFKRFFTGVEIEAQALASIDIEPLLSLLLTVANLKDTKAFRHTVLMTLIARVIAKRLKFDKQETITLTQAAQAHDIGELYLDPSSTLKQGRLTPEEWKKTMAHPKVGAMLIKHHTNYPPEVARAVYEHHERSDGTGYPRKLVYSQISKLGNVLIVSELLAGMLLKPAFPIRRALLVMKFLPKEFPKDVINAVHSYMTEKAVFESELEDDAVDWNQIKLVIYTFNEAEQQIVKLSQTQNTIIESEVIEEAFEKIIKIKRAIVSLGMEVCLDPFAWESIKDDPVVRLELDVAVREIAWRLRDTARDMVLNLGESAMEASAELTALIEKLSQVSLTKKETIPY
jgi:HD superfamily phosphohydrolase YqeK